MDLISDSPPSYSRGRTVSVPLSPEANILCGRHSISQTSVSWGRDGLRLFSNITVVTCLALQFWCSMNNGLTLWSQQHLQQGHPMGVQIYTGVKTEHPTRY